MATMSVTSAPAHIDEAEGAPQLRAGKRPRSGLTTSAITVQRRPFFDEHKWALLEKEQESERRRVEEAIRRLNAIEELRRRARERKRDRNRRRIEFAAMLEVCVLTLQRYERGRQARKVAIIRARATAKIIKWMMAKIRRAAMLRAIRNRTILRIMVSVESLVEEQLDEAKFFVQNVVALRAFQIHRSARIIQNALRRRGEIMRRAAAVIVRATRCWLARGSLRRARIRRGIGRFHGSLSRRALGLKEADPFAVPATRNFPTDGRWWDTGAPAVPRANWGTLRVENEEARSRQRARSLADLIRGGQPENEAAGAAAGAAAGRGQGGRGGHVGAGITRVSGGGGEDGTRETLPLPSWKTKRWRPGRNKGGDTVGKEAPRGGQNSNATQRAVESTEIPVGFGKRVTSRRAASMVDARDAEKAALLNELERQQARRKAVAPAFDKLSIVEKHLHREREFQEQREKRRAVAERQALKKEKQRAKEITEAARRKAVEAELLEKKEEESARKRLEKIHQYKEKKAARELAARKALAAQKGEERRAKAVEEAKRLAIETAFEKEKVERLERARRKRRPEEQQGRKRKDGGRGGGGGGSGITQKLSATAPAHHRTKKHASTNKSRTALAPIAVTNTGRDDGRTRKRHAARLSRTSSCTVVDGSAATTKSGRSAAVKASSTLRVAAGVRDGRRKLAPHGASIPALPVVPGWKAMAAGGTERVENRKRTRRRPPKRAIVGEAGDERGSEVDGERGDGTWATDDFDGILRARNSTADLERLLSTSAGGGGLATLAPAAGTGGSVLDENTGAEEYLDQKSSEQQRATNEVEQAEEEGEENGGQEQESHHLAGDECLSMETLDSAFPVPEEGGEIGGGGSLGETSAPGGFMSPGWSSRSSRRSSEAGETSSDALSDSAAIRHGKSLLSGESAGPVRGWRRSAGGGVNSAEEPAVATAEPREEHTALLPPATGDQERSPSLLVQLQPTAFPDDGVSDMSDNQTFIGRQWHGGEESGEDERGGFEGIELSPSYFGRENAGRNAQDVGVGILGAESAHLLAAGRLYTADEEHGGGVL